MGSPLPISYRDMVDEVERCAWPVKSQVEGWLTALDDEFLALAAKKEASVDKTSSS